MVTVPSTGFGAALDAPATRRCMRRRRMGGAAIVPVVAALVGLAVLLWRMDRDGVAADAGEVHVTAVIEAVEASGSGEHSAGTMTLSFADAAGVDHQRVVAVTDVRLLRVGQDVDVAYDPDDPDDVAVVSDPAPIPWFVPALGALVLACVGVDVAVRLRRTTAVLATNPWVEVTSKVLQIPLLAGPSNVVTMIELHGAPDDGVVLATAAGVRARPMADLAPRTWVAGDGHRFYLAAPGGAPVVRAKRIRLRPGAEDAFTVPTPLRSRVLPGQ